MIINSHPQKKKPNGRRYNFISSIPNEIFNQIGYNLTGNNLSKFLSVDK